MIGPGRMNGLEDVAGADFMTASGGITGPGSIGGGMSPALTFTGPSRSSLSRAFGSLITLVFAWVSGCVAQMACIRSAAEAGRDATA
jgi:hypothetical protein